LDGITCDLCGKSLLVEENVRYVAELLVYAAYDPMELTSEDLRRDIAAEIEKTLEALKKRDAKELEEEVVASRRLDLCPACRKRLLDETLRPIGGQEKES
jgi:hypothetical protein